MYKLDHIVHFVADPADAIEQFRKQGVHAVEGGKHDMWGTYNALSYFGLTYLEFISILDEEKFVQAATVPYTLHAKYAEHGRKNGFTKLALRTETMEQDAMKLREAGFDVNGPETFSRTRPDGSVVEWQMLHIGKEGSNVAYPFFIQWGTRDDERVADYKGRGIIAPHTAGDLVVQEVGVTVPSFDAFASIYRALDVDMTMTYDDIDETETATLQFEGGNIVFYLMEDEVPFQIQYVKFANAIEEKQFEYDGATYIFVK